LNKINEHKVILNTKHLPFFCFPCGKYHGSPISKHDNTITHRRNHRRWKKKMGYMIYENQRWKHDKDYSKQIKKGT